MWEKREADWEKERRARERLMKEVMQYCILSYIFKPGPSDVVS